MANFRFLGAVVLRILAGLCTVGGLAIVISYVVCQVGSSPCPGVFYSGGFAAIGVLLLVIGACLGLCIILFSTCRAFWRRIKYRPTSSTSTVENYPNAVVLRILTALCTVGGLATFISGIVCGISERRCIGVSVEGVSVPGSCAISERRCPGVSYAALSVAGLLLLIIGACLGLCIILFSPCRAFWRRIKYRPNSSTSAVENFLREYAYQMPTRYSLFKVKKITDNFAEKLGEGGYGVVYKGKLQNDTPVAVKVLDRHRHSEAQFMNEVATIGHLHHVNLVRLLGYCYESLTSALVYEYMPNGSLDKFLFAGRENGQLLTWEHLYSIALGAARGIAYLHQDCDKRIIHFDLKPHNILLDADFTPKVSDFGLAKLCRKGDDHISMTAGRGTPGYVAPELCSSDMGPVTDKSDVYSFGMLLLEIVGGRKNIDWKVSRSSQFYFPEWAFKLLETGDFGMRLRGGEMEAEDEEKAKRLTKIGGWCIQYNYRDRPSMARVVQMLEGNGDDVADPPMPCNSSSAQPKYQLHQKYLSCPPLKNLHLHQLKLHPRYPGETWLLKPI